MSETIKTFRAFLLLIRVPNLFIIALTQFLIAWCMIQSHLDYKLVLLITGTVLIAASGNIINDYFDVRFDRINKPDEIWVGNFFSRRTILVMHLIISVAGTGIGVFISPYVGIVNAACVAILWFYSQKFKCVPLAGNLIVSSLTGLVVLIMGLKYGYYKLDLMIFMIFSFLVNLIREITKDIEDIRGDYFFDCRTLATVYGIAYSKKILIGLQFALIGTLAFLTLLSPWKFSMYILLFLLPLTVIILFRSWKAHKKDHFKTLSRLNKLLILLGVLSLLLFKFDVFPT